MINNKRGQISLYLMVGVAIALCLSALYTFATFKSDFGTKSDEISNMISEVEFGQRYITESAKDIGKEAIGSEGDLKGKFKEIADKRYLGIEYSGNFFPKIRTDDFSFEKIGGESVLEVKGVVVQARRGDNIMKRNFDFEMRFDNGGNVLT